VPLYEYECAKCHRRTEKIESVSGPHLKKCPHCGGKVERLLAPPAIQFKGRPSENTASEKSQTTEKSESAKEAPAKETTPKDHKEKSTGKK